MGMYTRFHCDVTIKEDTPEDVTDALYRLCYGDFDDAKLLNLDHEFFKCERISQLFRGNSAYFPDDEQGKHEFGPIKADYEKGYHLFVKSSLKNYGDEIRLFTEWITPYLESGVIYSQYEESERITVHFGKVQDHE